MNGSSSSQPAVVMSGMRPTGRLHLGHYVGVLRNWVRLQHDHPCYFMVADWHTLTTKLDDTTQLAAFSREMVLDWLAAGLEPERCTLFLQSSIPEIAELQLLLSMATPVKWLETDPTLKDMVAMLRGNTQDGQPGEGSETTPGLSHGLLGYPVLQTADILSVDGTLVPVGQDQVAHLEISRDMVRRFNHEVGELVFREPRPLLTEVPMLRGLDGRKMGKSFNNAIFLSDSPAETIAKVKTAITDPQRVKKTDPGNPDECTGIYPLYPLFAQDEAEVEQVRVECSQALRGCMTCKLQLAERLNEHLAPLRERRQQYEADPAQVDALLCQGRERVRAEASRMLSHARRALRLLTLS